tara:strand:+ start:392 stop:1147 length:756 start_codon:yes stop_codon:yes gene_type:complete
MCEPTLIAVALGAGQAITGIQEQNRQHSAQVAAVDRQNTMARQNYINELNIASHKDQLRGRQYEAELKEAALAKTAYNRQLQINQESASNADVSEQMKLNEKITKAMFESQANLVAAIRAQGSVLASGMAPGQSMLLELQQAERELGFEQAQIDASIFDATRAYGIASFGIDLDQYSADTQAYNNLDRGPVFAPSASFAPVEPMKISRPSKPSILGPILSGVSTGLSTYSAVGGEFNFGGNKTDTTPKGTK